MKILSRSLILIIVLSSFTANPSIAMSRKNASVAPAPLEEPSSSGTFPRREHAIYHPEVVAESLPLPDHEKRVGDLAPIRAKPYPKIADHALSTNHAQLISSPAVVPPVIGECELNLVDSLADVSQVTSDHEDLEPGCNFKAFKMPLYVRYSEFPEKYKALALHQYETYSLNPSKYASFDHYLFSLCSESYALIDPRYFAHSVIEYEAILEVISALEAVKQKTIKGPIERAIAGVWFIDHDGGLWDIITPVERTTRLLFDLRIAEADTLNIGTHTARIKKFLAFSHQNPPLKIRSKIIINLAYLSRENQKFYVMDLKSHLTPEENQLVYFIKAFP